MRSPRLARRTCCISCPGAGGAAVRFFHGADHIRTPVDPGDQPGQQLFGILDVTGLGLPVWQADLEDERLGMVRPKDARRVGQN